MKTAIKDFAENVISVMYFEKTEVSKILSEMYNDTVWHHLLGPIGI